MKIEKISDNQIRCRLTPEDLAERQIQLSELAYGSEKARALFRDMMIQANKQYGFVNDANTPLMIEAIPGSGNSLTLVITKVEDPEELDTRFARFSPTEVVADGDPAAKVDGADDIIDIFHKLLEAKNAGNRGKAGGAPAKEEAGKPSQGREAAPGKSGRSAHGKDAMSVEDVSLIRAFFFPNIDDVIFACHALEQFTVKESALYRTKKEHRYILVVHQSQSPEDFNRLCNILSEYGSMQAFSAPHEAHLKEHEDCVLARNAVAKLGALTHAHA